MMLCVVVALSLTTVVSAAHAAQAVFQGPVTCNFTSTMEPFTSEMRAVVENGAMSLGAADPGWRVSGGGDFRGGSAPAHIVFAIAWTDRYNGPRDRKYSAGAPAHIRIAASGETLLTVKSEGGMTLCDGALALRQGSLADAIRPAP